MPFPKFVICAPFFDENKGGAIVTHLLCHLLNELGYSAFLYLVPEGMIARGDNFTEVLKNVLRWKIARLLPLKVNKNWNTPVIKHIDNVDDCVVVYPEIVMGNPLKARRVARWLLHHPGFHTGEVCFGSNEYVVNFNDFDSLSLPSSTFLSEHKLYVVKYPFDVYNMNGALQPDLRSGFAYCLRKFNKEAVLAEFNLKDGVCIDNLSHSEVALIFKQVKYFVSFDLHTAYSQFAVLCGAESIVIPEDGLEKDVWYPNFTDRYGIAYGFADLPWANKTASLVFGNLRNKEIASKNNVREFAEEVKKFFNL